MIFRWIQNNIEDYGGNPDDVTIVGMSAGGASVNYLTLSPQTKGLYKNAISLSGSSLCWWANIPHPREQVLI
jgi:bile salt-stimulated lipase